MKRLRGAYIMDIAPACEMYRAALARVAELESQLAAQGWRPVTETPSDAQNALIILRAWSMESAETPGIFYWKIDHRFVRHEDVMQWQPTSQEPTP